MISWSDVERKRSFLGYPLFVIARNFTMAIGYTIALATVASWKVRGKEISWNNL